MIHLLKMSAHVLSHVAAQHTFFCLRSIARNITICLANKILLVQGCSERTDPFIPIKPEWSAFRNSDYGYTKVKAWNTTHLYLEQISDDKVRMLSAKMP